MKIYVCRHGETDWNKREIIQGQVDIPLNENGIKQAKELAYNLKDVHFDISFTTSLSRAQMTLKEIKNYHPDLKTIIDDRIIEMNYGDYESTSRIDPSYIERKKSFFLRYPHGESYLDVAQRVYNFLDEIIDKYRNQDILLVCHSRAMAIISTYFMDLTNQEFSSFEASHTKPLIFEFE